MARQHSLKRCCAILLLLGPVVLLRNHLHTGIPMGCQIDHRVGIENHPRTIRYALSSGAHVYVYLVMVLQTETCLHWQGVSRSCSDYLHTMSGTTRQMQQWLLPCGKHVVQQGAQRVSPCLSALCETCPMVSLSADSQTRCDGRHTTTPKASISGQHHAGSAVDILTATGETCITLHTRL